MKREHEEICCRPVGETSAGWDGLAAAIFPSSVYRCSDPDSADRLLAGEQSGYVYQRDGHPNGDFLREKCRALHGGDWALLGSSGMAALSIATLTLLKPGDDVLLSDRLYGRTTQQLTQRWSQLGISCRVVDTLDLDAVAKSLDQSAGKTRMVIVETITNPMLRVASLHDLARLAHDAGSLLYVDNTFATPFVCRPLDFGADLVMESVSKMMNGHSDVMLGALMGRGLSEAEFQDTLSVWGLASAPFECWLAMRGLATFHLRMERACESAQWLSEQLASSSFVETIHYPGLATHADRDTVEKQFFEGAAGSVLTFDLPGGRDLAAGFIKRLEGIPFAPSLGEVSTTLSHPTSTSHRRLKPADRERLGIHEGTIRLSVGTEPKEWIWQQLCDAFAAN